jgi:hypothetical protein
MKFYETHFEEYTNKKEELHPKLEKIYDKFPKNIQELKNLIFYGPSGVGKYTQLLKAIKKYSPSELKYEKKISILYNKVQYFFKISDIHYEIDMSLLGCNSKLLWHEIYLQLNDIISTKTEKVGIIVCKYFHEIHNELLENFYSYMQKNNSLSFDLKFILITEQLSFIPENILNCCEIISVSRPTKTLYNKCLNNKIKKDMQVENITNIKNLHSSINDLNYPYKIICNKIIHLIKNMDDIKFLNLRDLLYDIFIYNLDINECIWYILSSFITDNSIKNSDVTKVLIKTYSFFQYYNNNYRPIYHLENYIFYLINIIHNLQ